MADTLLKSLDPGSFEAESARHPGLLVLDFWAEGCVPCRQLGKVLEQLASDLPPSVRIATVHAPDNPDLVQRFAVSSVPTLVFVKDGAVIETRTGVDRRQVLKKLIEQHA